MSKISGSCLCKHVQFECEDAFNHFHLCHCAQCQKISGSAHVSNLFTAPTNITWLSGEKEIKRYDLDGHTISNAFCTHCGCAVPYVSASDKALIIPAGSLDATPSINVDDNIFWAERAEWYEEAVKAKRCLGFPE